MQERIRFYDFTRVDDYENFLPHNINPLYKDNKVAVYPIKSNGYIVIEEARSDGRVPFIWYFDKLHPFITDFFQKGV